MLEAFLVPESPCQRERRSEAAAALVRQQDPRLPLNKPVHGLWGRPEGKGRVACNEDDIWIYEG